SAVDLVGEEEIREDRAGAELELRAALVEHGRARHVGGHQVGRELDAGEPERRRAREGAGDQRLGEAGIVLEQDVSFAEDGEEDELDRAALAYDRALDLVEDRGGAGPQLAELHHNCSSSSTTCASRRSGTPGADRSAGTGRSGRSSSHVSSSSASRGARVRASTMLQSSGRRREWKSPALAAASLASRSTTTSSGGRRRVSALGASARASSDAARSHSSSVRAVRARTRSATAVSASTSAATISRTEIGRRPSATARPIVSAASVP